MTRSLRRAVLVLMAVAVQILMAFLGHGYAQKGVPQVQPLPEIVPTQPANPENKDGFDHAGVELPKDHRLKVQIEAAADYIKRAETDQDWSVATRILQGLIEKKEDVFAHLPVSGPDGKEVM